MVKTIFLQDIKNRCEFEDNMGGYLCRDRLVSAIGSIVKKILKQIERTYRLKKNQLLCKDEKEQIEAYINERLSKLIDRKNNLIELEKKISGQGKNISVEEEVERILGNLPKQRTD